MNREDAFKKAVGVVKANAYFSAIEGIDSDKAWNRDYITYFIDEHGINTSIYQGLTNEDEAYLKEIFYREYNNTIHDMMYKKAELIVKENAKLCAYESKINSNIWERRYKSFFIDKNANILNYLNNEDINKLGEIFKVTFENAKKEYLLKKIDVKNKEELLEKARYTAKNQGVIAASEDIDLNKFWNKKSKVFFSGNKETNDNILYILDEEDMDELYKIFSKSYFITLEEKAIEIVRYYAETLALSLGDLIADKENNKKIWKKHYAYAFLTKNMLKQFDEDKINKLENIFLNTMDASYIKRKKENQRIFYEAEEIVITKGREAAYNNTTLLWEDIYKVILGEERIKHLTDIDINVHLKNKFYESYNKNRREIIINNLIKKIRKEGENYSLKYFDSEGLFQEVYESVIDASDNKEILNNLTEYEKKKLEVEFNSGFKNGRFKKFERFIDNCINNGLSKEDAIIKWEKYINTLPNTKYKLEHIEAYKKAESIVADKGASYSLTYDDIDGVWEYKCKDILSPTILKYLTEDELLELGHVFERAYNSKKDEDFKKYVQDCIKEGISKSDAIGGWEKHMPTSIDSIGDGSDMIRMYYIDHINYLYNKAEEENVKLGK